MPGNTGVNVQLMELEIANSNQCRHVIDMQVSLVMCAVAGFEESHKTFRRSMPEGFSWEVTEVWSG